jgi:hypothetical protein
MKKMSDVRVRPQTATVNGVEWTMSEVQDLRNIYQGRPYMDFEKTEIRQNITLQKALRSEVIMATSLQQGDRALLHMAQAGYELIGLIL